MQNGRFRLQTAANWHGKHAQPEIRKRKTQVPKNVLPLLFTCELGKKWESSVGPKRRRHFLCRSAEAVRAGAASSKFHARWRVGQLLSSGQGWEIWMMDGWSILHRKHSRSHGRWDVSDVYNYIQFPEDIDILFTANAASPPKTVPFGLLFVAF